MKRLATIWVLQLCGLLCISGNAFGATPSLADILDRAPRVIGPAPTHYSVPFLVMAVTPLGGDSCSLTIVTNGMLYTLNAVRTYGGCDHLPKLHSLVWGRVRHSRMATLLRESNMVGVASDYVDLVYSDVAGKKPRTMSYVIDGAEEIPPNWGQ